MKSIAAIDPGTTQSAFVIWNGKEILEMDICQNYELMLYLDIDEIDYVFKDGRGRPDVLIIEKIANMGMPAVGDSIFETAYWTGIFACAYGLSYTVRMPRRDVQLHLCGSTKARKPNVNQALKDRFEPNLLPRQRPKGILKGLKDHIWDAFALSVTYWDLNCGNKT